MNTVFIVGGDGFARECYLWLKILIKKENNICFGGFMGHGGFGKTVDYKCYQHLYVGEVSEHKFNDNEYVLIGAGMPYIRKIIYNELKERGIKFYNLIYNSDIAEYCNFGEANIIINSVFTANTSIGNGNVLNGSVIIAHDVQVGDFNFFGPRSQVLGYVKVGNENQIGANSILLPKSKIGNNNKIAPLSAIYKGCRDNCYMSGNPALKQGIIE